MLEGFEIDLQTKCKGIRHLLDTEEGITELLKHLHLLKGEKPGDKEREAHNEALFDYLIRPTESLTSFVIRRDSQIAQAERFGLSLPDAVQARYYEEGAQLTKQNRINLRTLMNGDKTVAAVRRALQELDVAEKSVLPQKPASTAKSFPAELDGWDSDSDQDDEALDLFEVEFPEEDVTVFLGVLDDKDLYEDEGYQVFMEMASKRRRTWKESRQMKAARKVDREFFDRKRGSKNGVPPPPTPSPP